MSTRAKQAKVESDENDTYNGVKKINSTRKYPESLCNAVRQGTRDHAQIDVDTMNYSIGNVELGEELPTSLARSCRQF